MKVYYDYENQKLVLGLSLTQQVTSFEMYLRDLQPIDLYLVEWNEATGAYTAVAAPAGLTPVFGAKDDTIVGYAGGYLAAQTAWTYDSVNKRFQAEIDLGDAALIAAWDAEDQLFLTIRGEFALRNGANRDKYTTQFDIVVHGDINRGDESIISGGGGVPFLVEEVVDGQKQLNLKNSDGVIYATWTIPGGN